MFTTDLIGALRLAITKNLQLNGTMPYFGLTVDGQENVQAQRLLGALFGICGCERAFFIGAVINGITVCGWRAYDQVVNQRIPPDHVKSPQALAYIMSHLSADQQSLIRFDHGETWESFVSMAHGLPELVLKQLGNAPK